MKTKPGLLSIVGASLLACGSGSSSGSGGATSASTSTSPAGTGTLSTSAATASTGSTGSGGAGTMPTVFLILMENNNWSAFKNSASAPYLNQTLLTQGAHAEQYFNPPNIHPSEPNYLWLEAGTNFGILDDNGPSTNSQTSTAHLVNLLEAAGIRWRTYEEDITGTVCPLSGSGKFAPRHDPVLFFEDVTNSNDAAAPRCIAHVRPYTELATDLASGQVSGYNFITPNLCHDGHDICAPQNDDVKQSDDWLSTEIPKIQASAAYQSNGIIIITWDEGEPGDGPIGLIVLSKNAKPGYSNSVPYDHSSTLKTVETLFGVTPLLGGAASSGTNDLSDLFTAFP